MKKYEWFIIKCPCGSEQSFINDLKLNLIKLNAEETLNDHYIPNLKKPTGKVTMGSYVFIKAEKSEKLDIAIHRISFASYLIDGSTNPAKTTEEEVKNMREKQKNLEEQEAEENKIEVGQKILIKDGPFKDFEGIIDKIDETTELVSVLVSVLGSQLSVKDLPFSSINVTLNEDKNPINLKKED